MTSTLPPGRRKRLPILEHLIPIPSFHPPSDRESEGRVPIRISSGSQGNPQTLEEALVSGNDESVSGDDLVFSCRGIDSTLRTQDLVRIRAIFLTSCPGGPLWGLFSSVEVCHSVRGHADRGPLSSPSSSSPGLADLPRHCFRGNLPRTVGGF